MKKYIPILLLLIVSLNHLNIFDSILHFSDRYALSKNKIEGIPDEKERETEKEKTGEKEKYLGKSYISNYRYKLSDKDHLICFTTLLHKHPYQEKDIQPPRNL